MMIEMKIGLSIQFHSLFRSLTKMRPQAREVSSTVVRRSTAQSMMTTRGRRTMMTRWGALCVARPLIYAIVSTFPSL